MCPPAVGPAWDSDSPQPRPVPPMPATPKSSQGRTPNGSGRGRIRRLSIHHGVRSHWSTTAPTATQAHSVQKRPGFGRLGGRQNDSPIFQAAAASAVVSPGSVHPGGPVRNRRISRATIREPGPAMIATVAAFRNRGVFGQRSPARLKAAATPRPPGIRPTAARFWRGNRKASEARTVPAISSNNSVGDGWGRPGIPFPKTCTARIRKPARSKALRNTGEPDGAQRPGGDAGHPVDTSPVRPGERMKSMGCAGGGRRIDDWRSEIGDCQLGSSPLRRLRNPPNHQ